MLTKAQIQNAVSEVQNCSFHRPSVGAVKVVDELAAAYERVVALRQELVDFMASSNTRPMLAITDVLRKLDRALEG
jgi:hypothetical protein